MNPVSNLLTASKSPSRNRLKEARKEVLTKLAIVNANSEVKAILRALPLDPEPKIAQMVEACVKHTSTENTVAQAVAKGIAEGISRAFAIVAAKDYQRCFNCGDFGHFLKTALKDCPLKTTGGTNIGSLQTPTNGGSQEMASRVRDSPTQ